MSDLVIETAKVDLVLENSTNSLVIQQAVADNVLVIAADGPQGATGADGAAGPAGPGVPVGGADGQILAKNSATDFDTDWVDPVLQTDITFANLLGVSSDNASLQTALDAKLDSSLGNVPNGYVALDSNGFMDGSSVIPDDGLTIAKTSGLQPTLDALATTWFDQAGLDTVAGSAGLVDNHLYYVTDAKHLAIGIDSSTYAEFPNIADLTGKANLTGATFSGAISATNLSGTNTGDETGTGIVTKLTAISGGGTSRYLRADGTWATPPAGTAIAVGTTAPSSPSTNALWVDTN